MHTVFGKNNMTDNDKLIVIFLLYNTYLLNYKF